MRGVEVRINGMTAVVSDGIWHSQDPALQQMLTALCASELLTEGGYVPDADLACARIAQEQLGAEIVNENLLSETYPGDAVF